MEREHGALQTVPEGLSISTQILFPLSPWHHKQPFAGLFMPPPLKWDSLKAESTSLIPPLWHKRMSPFVPLHLLY